VSEGSGSLAIFAAIRRAQKAVSVMDITAQARAI
jgi:hypothetical protein